MQSVSGDTVTVLTSDGQTVTVTLGSGTTITKSTTAASSDITTGENIVVRGDTTNGTAAQSVIVGDGALTGGFPGGGAPGGPPTDSSSSSAAN